MRSRYLIPIPSSAMKDLVRQSASLIRIANGLAATPHTACLSCCGRFRTYSTATEKHHSAARRNIERSKRTRLPERPARTRFAPSPTGYLHLGSLRTALYNFLLARATNGQFLLRLEDTDQSRIVLDAETRLYDDLRWSGLTWDEGPDCGGSFGPYKQSERLGIYREHANRLIREGKAFRCFCSHEDLASHNQKSLDLDGTFGTYPGRCLSISEDESAERAANGEAHTVRFKSSAAPVEVHDIVYGAYKKKLPEDHFIIMKSDGFPTYHFANVVDDHHMEITHVIRGAEWLISTAKHVSLYNAFGWEAPQFAHVGLLVDSKRQKLSKRNMDIGIDSYKRDSVLPSALLNFAALLGWNPSTSMNKGIMTLDDMVKTFDLRFTKGDIVVSMEKLNFFNKKHIRMAIDCQSSDTSVIDEALVDPMLRRVREIETGHKESSPGMAPRDPQIKDQRASLGNLLMDLDEAEREVARHRIRALLSISRADTVAADEMVEANKFLIWQPSTGHIRCSYSQLDVAPGSVFIDERPASIEEVISFFAGVLDQADPKLWASHDLQKLLNETASKITCQQGEVTITTGYKFLRWALLGLSHGPQIGHLVNFLGKEETVRRLRVAESIARSHAGLDTA